MTEYALAELASSSGVSPRTIRFYIQQGLLLPPDGAGSAASYPAENLARLRHIRRLSAQNLPLAEIRKRLSVLTEAQLREETPPYSAIEYIRHLKGEDVTVSRSMAAPAPKAPIERSHWERFALAPDVEIHVRRPLDRETDRALKRLLELAAEVFAKEGE